ncbi:MAG TPA: hypothetical protein P5137_14455, partial [Candidatus Brocadiia bacterium]|nr:hypothetical protein [Candidatus Brocadiia bacterium]
ARIEGGCAYTLLDFAPLPAGEYNLVVSVGEARDAVLATRRVPFSRVAGPPPGLTGAIPILVPPGPIRYEGWPVRSAVALPKGAVTDLSQIRLLDRGRESPCGLSAISRWAPDGSLRWVGLDFPAYISAGSPMTYTVEYGPAVKRAAAKGIEHWSVAGVIVVNAGAVMLNVPQNSFVGVQDAWVDSNRDGVFTDAEQVIWTRRGPAGPYLVDAEGQRYLASLDPDPRVTVEEAGDYRNVIRAEGWLVAEPAAAPAPAAADKPAEAPKPQPAPAQPPSKRLGRFLTRIISYYGQPFFRVQQTFIFTQEPAKTPIQDMGFLIQAETHPDSRTVAMGADGHAHEVKLADKPLCLIQSGPGACEVQGGPEPIQAKASDGWGAVFSTRPHRRGPIHKGLSVVLANASRRYPNEIEVTPAGHIVVHTWPAHWPAGAARAAVASLKDTGRLDAFHTGPLLNLSLSGGAAGGAAGAEKTAVEEAVKSSALGVAVTTDILFLPEAGPMNTQAVMQMARINAAAPHALPSAHSLAAAGVLPAAAMPAAAEFQAAQAAMTSLWARLLQNEQRDPQDGLFNYLSFHSEWLSEGRWRLSNHWVGVRHGLPSALWSLYLFTGDPAVRLAASDNTRLLADVAVCHYDTPEAAALTDLASRKVRGGFAQPATFVQWYAANGLTKWWSRPDFLGLAYVISGEPRALDALQEWAAALPLAEGYPSGDDGLATLSGLAAAWEIAPTPLNLHRLRLAASAVLDGFVEDITPSHYASFVLHYGRLTGDPKAADFLQRLAGRCAASRDATENPAYLEIYAGAQALTGSPRFAETARHCAEGLLAAKASLEKPSWATAAALFRGLPCALALPAQAAPATP